ncbi:hypothetical protein COO91_09340 (plasmid) [Nostoc flagelliforme CCNUN1]|uniref:Uncharacterized protein n=1 Tax=Nostoc flagelliforme CCNUN1 TaxID=2038116 RepID=A0A2K8T690_9NOSO|nr:hypothetical protein COO91_09340 [Nostoc flagelliforme CCNUN1]
MQSAGICRPLKVGTFIQSSGRAFNPSHNGRLTPTKVGIQQNASI